MRNELRERPRPAPPQEHPSSLRVSAGELPGPGTPTLERVRAASDTVRGADASELSEAAEDFKALLSAIAVRGSDADVKALLALLEGDSLQYVEDEHGTSLESLTVHALLSSGNPMALAVPTRAFGRYNRSPPGEMEWHPLRKVGLALTLTSVLMVSLGAAALWALMEAFRPSFSLYSSLLALHGFILTAAVASWQAWRRKRNASALWPKAAIGLGLGAAWIVGVGSDFLLALICGVLVVPGPLLLIPTRKKAPM